MAQQTIQTSADLLATGVPSQAPDVLKLLRDEKLVHDDDKDEKKSALADGYSSRLKEFRGIKDDIGKQDDSVDWSAYGTYDISSGAFLAVKEHVKDLKAILRATPGPSPGKQFFSRAIQTSVETAVLNTLDNVHDEIEKASDRVQTHANDIRGSAPTYGSSGPSYVPSNYMQHSYSPGPGYVPSATTADYARYQGSVSVDAAIEGALDALGITDPVARENWKRGYRVLIERESGGNPNAVNNWDSNAAAGKASRGLTQTIPGTFQAYHAAGTSANIHDPVANVAASMRYVMERYDVSRDGHDLQAKVQQTDPGRSAKGY
ncbi:transglycosylase SLT domain-containing protein [Nocardia sp. NBC_00508]|uniref:transglycosylase SLT domain-containing protein n=1 Tax=Nocardia sp. NBC_00508 TaxID=2975992 RepID=UPI002E815299|nr:transglycosylase SLT domain-containing protein [Nocardia sp. NBC_00508]WUD64213.1 transglycosylase SLT domain-containing protein [Nocardia sp. NBC_00508]